MSKIKASILITLFALTCVGVLATQKTTTVKFKAGTSSASYSGSIKDADVRERGNQSDSYVLGASKGQIMKIEASANLPLYIYVWNKSEGYNQGFVLDSSGADISTRFQLPASADYQVDIDRGHKVSQDVNYQVKFSIRP